MGSSDSWSVAIRTLSDFNQHPVFNLRHCETTSPYEGLSPTWSLQGSEPRFSVSTDWPPPPLHAAETQRPAALSPSSAGGRRGRTGRVDALEEPVGRLFEAWFGCAAVKQMTQMDDKETVCIRW